MLEKQANGLLLASVELPFDDPDLAGMTVADVLDDPARFAGETLADPIEGVEDGRCKAKVMWDGVGPPFIHSFAHGHSVYRLRYDAAAVRARIAQRRRRRSRRWSGWSAWPTSARSRSTHWPTMWRSRAGVGVRAVKSMLKAAARCAAGATGRRRRASGAKADAQRPAPAAGPAGARCRVAAGARRARRGRQCGRARAPATA